MSTPVATPREPGAFMNGLMWGFALGGGLIIVLGDIQGFWLLGAAGGVVFFALVVNAWHQDWEPYVARRK